MKNRYNIIIPLGVLVTGFLIYRSFDVLRKQAVAKRPVALAESTYSGRSGKFLGESIGVAANAGATARMLLKGTELPAGAVVTFSGVRLDQRTLEFDILSGEEVLAAKNHILGHFASPMTPTPKGPGRLQVTFAVAQDGTLTVTAKDLGSGSLKALTYGQVQLQ